jgi:hypothetical protein
VLGGVEEHDRRESRQSAEIICFDPVIVDNAEK